MTTQNTLEQLNTTYTQITKSYADTMDAAANHIAFSNAELETAKEDLVDFITQHEALANKRSLKERIFSVMADVPLIGSTLDEKVTEIRKEKLNDKSITEVVNKLYDAMDQKTKSLQNTVEQMISIGEQTVSLLSIINKLDQDIDSLLTSQELSRSEKLNSLKLSTQVKLMVESATDKVHTLDIITQVGEGVLINLVKILPATKTELLNRIVMDAGVSQIISISQDVKDIVELNDRISSTIQEKTHKATMMMLDANTTSEADIRRIRDNSVRRGQLQLEIKDAIEKHDKALVEKHKQITQTLLDTSNTHKVLEHTA